MIINELAKEIILVDPWPSYCEDADAPPYPERTEALCSWLLTRCGNGYKVIGILVTHEHFDHIQDIPKILTRLSSGNVLPTIVADKGSYLEISRLYEEFTSRPAFDTFPFLELKLDTSIGLSDDAVLHDNSLLDCPPAGRALHAVDKNNKTVNTIGSYSLNAYVWDHATTFPLDARCIPGNPSGNLQRTIAYLLQDAGNAKESELKSLFIVGSAGEMSSEYTDNAVVQIGTTGEHKNGEDPNKLYVDMLIQAVTQELKRVDESLQEATL
jgi:hypothetical protein